MNTQSANLAPRSIAYFSMEIGLEQEIKTYSGGLGMLAGDALRSAADLSLPMVAVTLAHRKGYFRQHLDEQGNQTETADTWAPEERLEALAPRVTVEIEGRPVALRAWRYDVEGVTGAVVPVYLLDADLPENGEYDRALTDELYGGDDRYRLCQEALLGIGGVAMLEALGHKEIRTYHMNEGHSALLTLALLERRLGARRPNPIPEDDLNAVESHCIFTTHTPVPAGHDKFKTDLVKKVLGAGRLALLEAARCCPEGVLNMTFLALTFSRYTNGVAMLHGEVSGQMFPNFPVHAITNGVHAATWICPPMGELFDRRIGGWRRDNLYLRYAVSIPLNEIRAAHAEAKEKLLAEVKTRAGVELNPALFTLGFARRSTPYKRADLLFKNPERLAGIAAKHGGMQIVYAGKAHPRDEGGKELIRKVHAAARALEGQITVVYLEGYDMDLGRLLTAGVDVWLNNPIRPLEASGTSGMKAAMNGVPSLSVLDGWWVEGWIEGVTGWSIGDGQDGSELERARRAESAAIYRKLGRSILPLFYRDPEGWAEVMRASIALNGSFFNTQRMVAQYDMHGYRVCGEN